MPEDVEIIMIYRTGLPAHGIRVPAGAFDAWLQKTIADGYFVEGKNNEFVVPWHAVASIQRHWGAANAEIVNPPRSR